MSLEEVTAAADQIRTAVESDRVQLLTELREPIPAGNGLQKMVDDAVDRTGVRMTGACSMGFRGRDRADRRGLLRGAGVAVRAERKPV